MEFQTSFKLLLILANVLSLLLVSHKVSRYFVAKSGPTHVDKDFIQNVMGKYNPNTFDSEAPALAELTKKYNETILKRKIGNTPVTGHECDSMPWLGAVTCDICEYAVAGLKYLVRTKTAQSDIEAFTKSFCILGEIEDEKVCNAVVEQFRFDFVIFTGDIPPHNVWNQSRSDQLTALQFYTDTMKKYLPGEKVFNALGNHESSPVDSFPPPFRTGKDSENWLYNDLAASWLTWLPQNTKPTITKAGFCTVSSYPGLRIISLNMNMCNYNNWWLLINNTDPAGMLQWFVGELQDAENMGDKVHVIGHIMPGCNCCLKPFSWNYYKIVNRFENTIVEQFFGHSHANQYQMFYDDVTFKRPIGLVHIPGSITTYSFLNPGFRIYEIDGNYNGSSWEEFSMNSLFPKDWNDLIYKAMTHDDLFEKLCVHWWKSTPNQCSTCKDDCRKGFLCSYKTGLNGGPDFCKDL